METKPLTDLVKIAKSAVADSPLDAVRTIKIKTTNTTTKKTMDENGSVA